MESDAFTPQAHLVHTTSQLNITKHESSCIQHTSEMHKWDKVIKLSGECQTVLFASLFNCTLNPFCVHSSKHSEVVLW